MSREDETAARVRAWNDHFQVRVFAFSLAFLVCFLCCHAPAKALSQIEQLCQEARHYLERAVALNPDLPQAVLAYGRALARTGDIEKAVERFQRVVRLAPEEDSVHLHLASAYRHSGRPEEAKAELARFEELAKKKSERTREMARLLIEMTRAAQETVEEPEPSFSPGREPTHH